MRHYYDTIVIGSGIAGLTSAIYLKKFGLDVIVLTKNSNLTESNTYYAQVVLLLQKMGTLQKSFVMIFSRLEPLTTILRL
jgi:thioredoxin reductase